METLSDGLIIEFGIGVCSEGEGPVTENLPAAFPNSPVVTIASLGSVIPNVAAPTIGADVSDSQITVTCPAPDATDVGGGSPGFRWMAMGY